MSLGMAEEAAKARFEAAKQHLYFAQQLIRDAAGSVVRSESDGVVAAMTEQLQQAYKTIAACGPDLWWLLEQNFVTDLAAKEAANRLGRNPIGWDEFVQRRRHSAWQAALHALQDDPDARLPSPPSS
jgi:hypothetical protein